MKLVYVIMENDFPSAVADTEERAVQWIAEAKAKHAAQNVGGPRIYRVIHAFELLK